MSKSGTKKGRLEAIQKELEEEVKVWDKEGYSIGQIGHPPESIFQLKAQHQALINTLITLKVVDEEELNITFKTIILNDMKMIRENMIEPAKKEALRQSIVDGINFVPPADVIPDPRLKSPWEK